MNYCIRISDSTLHNAYAGAPFKAKASILLHVLDYPGISKVMGVVGSGGIQGCAFCSLSGERSEQLHKTVYLQNRRFLLPSSPLRRDKVKYASRSVHSLYSYIFKLEYTTLHIITLQLSWQLWRTQTSSHEKTKRWKKIMQHMIEHQTGFTCKSAMFHTHVCTRLCLLMHTRTVGPCISIIYMDLDL